MKRIAIAVESSTMASKARKILRREGVSSRIIYVDNELSTLGCRYGLEVTEADFFAAVAALRRASISYKVINQ